MKRTSVTTLVTLAVIGGIVAALVQAALASSGRPIVMIPVTLPIALTAIGVVVVIMAVPIRRTTRRPPERMAAISPQPTLDRGPVDPFYATRVLTLAKSCALAGALLTGVGAGALIYILTRSVTPPLGSTTSAASGLVGAAVLLACGLVAEAMCRIPPGDDDDDEDDGPPGSPSMTNRGAP